MSKRLAGVILHVVLVAVSCGAFVYLARSKVVTVAVPVRDVASERVAVRALDQRDQVIRVLQADVQRLRTQLHRHEVADGR